MAIVIGIIYDVNENWIAGSYYIENLILSLDSIATDKPHLKIYSSNQVHFENLQKKTNYPNISWVPLIDQNNILDKIINKISYLFLKKHLIVRGIDTKIDILFPASDTYFFDNIKNKLFWIPDFQEIHFPEFFSKQEIVRRTEYLKKIAKRKWPIVVSSEHGKSDFQLLFPQANNKVFVLPFAVTLPLLENVSAQSCREKYSITQDYFICSNQFWAHKNHLTLLLAIKELKKRGGDILVVFTGKPNDFRNPNHYADLLKFIAENDLGNNVLFLGFIDRKDQLELMKNSIAIIQPSLFEGWSTVVEDAKALNHIIIASDIPVHREQLGNAFKYYFLPNDHQKLSVLMETILVNNTKSNYSNYKNNIIEFGNKVMSAFIEVTYGASKI